MILTDNIVFLKKHFPQVWSYLKINEDKLFDEHIKVVPSRSGYDTIACTMNDRLAYLHSQYDPINEAHKLIDSLGDISHYKHVFFFGVGLGYHIDVFFQKHTNIPFTMYEPEDAVFNLFLEKRLFKEFPARLLQNIYLGFNAPSAYSNDFIKKIKGEALLVVLPSYERVFADKVKVFYDDFKAAIDGARISMATNIQYEKLWITNSMKNFPKVLSTASALREKRNIFEGKPVIVAAAGPSLQDEYDNLRKIKENRSAFIVAVGSANKALIAKGIYPDAMTTYDPNPWNVMVYEDIIEQKIDSIPLIFGSSVGFKTIDDYPGPLLHMITSQDSISSFYLNGPELVHRGEVISDAPSIAVLTLEIFLRLNASHIIFVGQNLSYRLNQFYAEGVNYSYRSSIYLTEAEKQGLLEVESVDGDYVMADKGNNGARLQMERMLVGVSKEVKVINSTKGGAKIHGTEYIPLEQVMEQFLTESVVDPKWYTGEPTSYDLQFIGKQIEKMENSLHNYSVLMDKLIKILNKIEHHSKRSEIQLTEKQFAKFDKGTIELLKNDYFNIFLRPMLRVYVDIVGRESRQIALETNTLEKAKQVIKTFGNFFYHCKVLQAECEQLYNQFTKELKVIIQKSDENVKESVKA